MSRGGGRGSHASGLDPMGALLGGADIGVICVDGAAELVDVKTLDRRALGRLRGAAPTRPARPLHPARGRPPRRRAGRLGRGLRPRRAASEIVERNRGGRAQAMDDVGTILVSERPQVPRACGCTNRSPAIEELKGLRSRARGRRRSRHRRAGHARGAAAAHAMEKKFLWLALEQMKQGARHTLVRGGPRPGLPSLHRRAEQRRWVRCPAALERGAATRIGDDDDPVVAPAPRGRVVGRRGSSRSPRGTPRRPAATPRGAGRASGVSARARVKPGAGRRGSRQNEIRG